MVCQLQVNWVKENQIGNRVATAKASGGIIEINLAPSWYIEKTISSFVKTELRCQN